MTAAGMAAWVCLALGLGVAVQLLWPGPPVRQHVDILDEKPDRPEYRGGPL